MPRRSWANCAKPSASATWAPSPLQADGRFHFKLVEGDRVLLLSQGFESPRDAGQRLAALRRDGFSGPGTDLFLGDGVAPDEVESALATLRAADESKA